MVKQAYKHIVPETTRLGLWKLRKRVFDTLHEARWNMATPEYIERWTEQRLQLGNPDSTGYWLFILGCNNSGTTLLMRILETHPSIRGLHKEGQFATKALPTPVELNVGRLFSQRLDAFRWTEDSDASAVARICYDWAARFDPPPGILLEKSPTNTLRSRWLQHNFQPARFITLVRSPYAVCEGIRRRLDVSIEVAATHWQVVHEILYQDMKCLDQCLWLQYEDLCEFTQTHVERMAHFMELDRSFPPVSEMSFQTHNMDGKAQGIRNFNARSLQQLSEEDIRTINRITETEMRLFGYEPIGIS